MADKATTLTITGKVGYEDEITVIQAARIIAFLDAAEHDATLGPNLHAGLGGESETDSAERVKKSVGSAREALDLSGAKTNPEKIVALGQYVLQDGGETFKVGDVKAQFRRARETAPANFSRDLAAAVKEGWIAQGDGDEYYITNKIQGILDGNFEFPKSTSGGGSRARGVARTTVKPNAKPEVFADIDEFPTRMAGFPAYPKMKSNRDKLLWALHLAKTQGIKGLANKDLAWLTDHLGAGVPTKQVTAAFNSGKSAGYMNRSTLDQTIRSTDDGEAYLKTAGATDS